ncbi:MAG: hypothetical protein NZ521_00180 [Flammeovirgaceae bacterium]|nr:hypothetical protein [Flammeovirgaceae bacterium]MDW8286470.1 hypothetical protein [Flammeovirgaceae bacterium]
MNVVRRFFKILLLTIITTNIYAQVALKGDFLGKPDLWKKVVENYNDSLAWSAYVGVPWACMTLSERKHIQQIRDAFRKEIAKQTQLVDNSPTDNNFWEENNTTTNTNTFAEMTAREKAFYNQQLESVINEEPPVLVDLKKNLNQNFLLIEDTLKDEFEMLGGKYEYYDKVHPDKKYSKELWVSEKTKELKELKRKKYAANAAK